jgi:hypothetical protein
MRRRNVEATASPFCILGSNFARCTALIASRSKMRAGFDPITRAFCTEPSGATVNSTSTQPSWRLRAAASG